MTNFNLCTSKRAIPLSKGVATARSLLLLLALFLLTLQAFSQIAPVTNPTGGFAIDGGLRANTPTTPSPFAPGQGDWYPGTVSGSGGFVFNNSNIAVNTATSGRATPADLFNSGSDQIFTNGSKFNDPIGALRWTAGTAPDKNDINNALYHVSRDGFNNQWAFIAGDRLSTNGTSYIDFEFLQGTVVRNANGTFTGTIAPNKNGGGGRTENDMIISMEYTSGGSKPNVLIYQWKQINGVWQFQQINPTGLANNAFAETNRVSAETGLPYPAFGVNTYAQFAFVEAAINISFLLNQTGQACAGLKINTLWVKTKASAASTAALKDFVDPISVNLDFGSIAITQAGPFCVNNTTPQTLEVTGVANLTGTFSGKGIVDNKFVPSVAGVGTHTITFTSSDGSCNATTTITVNGLPTANAGTAPAAQCFLTTGNTFNLAGTVSNGTAAWTIVSKTNDNINVQFGSTSAASTTATLSGGTGSVTLRLTATSSFTPSCGTATSEVTLTVNPNPTANAGTAPAAQCLDPQGNTFSLNGAVTNGTPSWSVVSKSNDALSVNVATPGSAATNVTIGGGSGTVTFRLTSTSNALPSCGTATSEVTVTVNPNPTADAGTAPAAQCFIPAGNIFNLAGTVTNGTASWSVVSKSDNALVVTIGSPSSSSTNVTITGGNGNALATVTLRLTSTSGFTPSCGTAIDDITLSINSKAPAPSATVLLPDCDDPTMSVKVLNPVVGVTYKLSQPSINGTEQTITAVATPNSSDDPSIASDVIFSGLSFGKGYRLIAVNESGCSSQPDLCGPQTPTLTQQVNNNQSQLSQSQVRTQTIKLDTENQTKVQAAPNPFREKVRFQLESAVSGYGSLEIYNTQGQRVGIAFQGYVEKGRTQTIEYTAPAMQQGTLMYVFRVGDQRVSGKLINLR